jgi:methionyl-tRNA synthetase
MICPMCKQEMDEWDYCSVCGILHYSIRDMQNPLTSLSKKFAAQYPCQPAYYFEEHKMYYTLTEMERMARLKAFL